MIAMRCLPCAGASTLTATSSAAASFFASASALVDLGLEALRRQRAGNDRAVGEHQRRRRVDPELRAELGACATGLSQSPVVVRQRAGAKNASHAFRRSGAHQIMLRLARGVRMQLVDRKQERVDRHVVDVLQLLLEPRAERAVGVREHDIVRAPLPFTFLIARSSGRRDVDAIELALALLGQVHLGVGVVHRADQDVLRPWRRCRRSGRRTAPRTGRNTASWSRRAPLRRELLLEVLLDGGGLAGQRRGLLGAAAEARRRPRRAADRQRRRDGVFKRNMSTSPESMAKRCWTSLAQRGLRQGALEEREPINGGHAGIAHGRQPRRRRPEQARQAVGHACIASTGSTRRRA